jgi:signal transduction histidine kinase/ActR/RegA family two-component response regulator
MSTYELSRDPPLTLRASSRPRVGLSIARRAALVVVAYVLLTGGLLALLLMQLRSEAETASRRELGAFAQLVAGHTFEVALGLEDALKLTEVTLSVAGSTGSADEESIRAMLHEVVGNARALKDILVLDERGRVVHQASGRADIGADWSDRPYFARFKADKSLKFDLATATERGGARAAAAEWVIPVVHAWRRADGSFAGLIVGLMDPQFFDRAWTFDAEIAGVSIALTGRDGGVIMRRPFDADTVGRPVADRITIGHLSPDRAADTLISDDDRLLAYRRVAAYPNLVVFVAQPMDEVLAGWQQVAWIVGSGWLLASLGLGGLGLRLARERRARGLIETRYHALFDSIPQPVIVSDAGSAGILAFNAAAVHQYGAAMADGPLPADFSVLAERRREFTEAAAVLIRDQRHRNSDRAEIDVELTVRQIDYDGRPALLTVAADVSDRLRAERERHAAEEQLRQSQKMEVLGQLTGGIAHDFNNMLMVIIDGVEELADSDAIDGEMRKSLQRIATSAERAEDLTRQMLAFSRKQPLRPRMTNVNDLVTDTGKLLRRALGEQVEIDSILADELWTVDVDRAQLETALVNLCLNARDAMPNGGRVLVETRNIAVDAALAAHEPGLGIGDHVLITVSDTGHGILPQHVDKVFEPFFTTKASGKGSGLGLSMVYGFIKQSRGHIAFSTEVDRGTAFRIYLPRSAGELSVSALPRPAPMTGGTERLLVVEDDPQVRASVVRQLQSLGYAVSQAGDGVAGLAAVSEARRPFDLLLTDVVMPGPLNGKALADEVGRRAPATRVVFMSGYTDNILLSRGSIDAGVRLLNKPFRKSDLARMIREALDERAP